MAIKYVCTFKSNRFPSVEGSQETRSGEGEKLVFHWIFFYAVWPFYLRHVIKIAKHRFNKISLKWIAPVEIYLFLMISSGHQLF